MRSEEMIGFADCCWSCGGSVLPGFGHWDYTSGGGSWRISITDADALAIAVLTESIDSCITDTFIKLVCMWAQQSNEWICSNLLLSSRTPLRDEICRRKAS